MAKVEHMTIRDLRRAIRKARTCYVTPRYGLTERYLRVAKAEALFLVEGFDNSLSPGDLEMYAGCFGHTDDEGDLYLG